MYSLESPRWGDSNEYTQHTIPWQNKKKILNICFLELLEEFCRDWKKSSNHPRWTSHTCSSHWSYTVCSLYNTVKVYRCVVCNGVKILNYPHICFIQVLGSCFIWAAPCKNVSSGICGQRRPRSACASAQSDQGLWYPLTESLDTIECINGWIWFCAFYACWKTHFRWRAQMRVDLVMI